jgi:hypothetical protein
VYATSVLAPRGFPSDLKRKHFLTTTNFLKVPIHRLHNRHMAALWIHLLMHSMYLNRQIRCALELRLAHHRRCRVRRDVSRHLRLELLRQYRRPACGSDEPKEGRRGVQRARAEFGVRLEADEEGVVWIWENVSE